MGWYFYLSSGYGKDGFASRTDGFVPSKRILVKYFADAKCEISAVALVKFFAHAESEMKSIHRRSDFTRRKRILHREAVFHSSAKMNFTEKSTCFSKCFFWCARRELNPHVRSGH